MGCAAPVCGCPGSVLPDGGSYAVRADVDPNVTIGSVRLALIGAKTVSRTENVTPYSLHGDGGENDLHGASLPAGSYTMTAFVSTATADPTGITLEECFEQSTTFHRHHRRAGPGNPCVRAGAGAGNPACPNSWPGTNYGNGGGIEYQDFYTDHDHNRWFIVRSRDSNGYTHIRAYPEDRRYEAGYTPGEACSFIVRRPGDEDPREWKIVSGLTGLEGDRQMLASFYRLANGDDWFNNDGWLTSRPLSEWYGVTTSAEGRVVGLNLKENGLTGIINACLYGLTELERLELYGNELTGPIPPELGDILGLMYLDLDDSNLSGPIPPELGNLSNLVHLGLDRNELTGPIPPELGRLSNLEGLELYDNNLTAPIPPELGNLTNLEVLALSSNDLTGPIPSELGNLTNLYLLWLSNTRLSGPIPPELGNMTSMEWLSLHSNDLSGAVPRELANLTNLVSLRLSGNQLTGCIPANLETVVYDDFQRAGLEFCDGS